MALAAIGCQSSVEKAEPNATVNLKLETSEKVPMQGGGPVIEKQVRYKVYPQPQGQPGGWMIVQVDN